MADEVPAEYLAEPDRYFMEWIPRVLADHPEVEAHIGSGDAIAQIELAGDRGGTWHFVLAGGKVTVDRVAHAEPSFVIAMAVETWQRMNRGELSVPRALLLRRIKTRGSLRALVRVAKLFKQ